METATRSLRVATANHHGLGRCEVTLHSRQDAMRRGFRMAWTTFGLALLSILLPGIHFVSVPLGILAAPFVGLYSYRKSLGAPRTISADFECPDCQARNRLEDVEAAVQYKCACVGCGHEVRLTP